MSKCFYRLINTIIFNQPYQLITKKVDMKPIFLVLILLICSNIIAQDAKSYFDSGNEKYKVSDYKGAIVDYNKAIQLDPDYINAYSSRGWAKISTEDYKGAMADFNTAIRLDPEEPNAYNSRGFLKGFLDDHRGAIQDFNKSIKLDPEYETAYYNRGIAKKELGDINGACWDWSKAGELGDYSAYEKIREFCN